MSVLISYSSSFTISCSILARVPMSFIRLESQKVDDFWVEDWVHHDILKLQVAVHHLTTVDVRHTDRNSNSNFQLIAHKILRCDFLHVVRKNLKEKCNCCLLQPVLFLEVFQTFLFNWKATKMVLIVHCCYTIRIQ